LLCTITCYFWRRDTHLIKLASLSPLPPLTFYFPTHPHPHPPCTYTVNVALTQFSALIASIILGRENGADKGASGLSATKIFNENVADVVGSIGRSLTLVERNTVIKDAGRPALLRRKVCMLHCINSRIYYKTRDILTLTQTFLTKTLLLPCTHYLTLGGTKSAQ